MPHTRHPKKQRKKIRRKQTKEVVTEAAMSVKPPTKNQKLSAAIAIVWVIHPSATSDKSKQKGKKKPVKLSMQ